MVDARCLDENELAGFVEAGEGSAIRTRVHAHVDGCPFCRALLATFVGTMEKVAEPQPPMPVDAPLALTPGEVLLDRFELERAVGQGGSSVVWAARDRRRGGASVALKILMFVEPVLRRRMLREARVMERLDHPAILDLYEVLTLGDDGPPMLVCELLRGRTLAERFREGPLSVRDTRAIFRPILEAIAFAHGHGVVHRDLKPGNVFLAEGGVRVIDFGFARLTAAAGALRASGTLTQRGFTLGTARYMALEQLHGEPDVDARADVWALGAMLYEALTGGPAVTSSSFASVFKLVSLRKIRPLREMSPGLPEPVTSLVDEMLAYDRANRPGDVPSILRRMNAW